MTTVQVNQRHSSSPAPVQAATKVPVSSQSQSFGPASEQIRRRAYEIYVAKGRREGLSDSDWLEAERQLSRVQSQTQTPANPAPPVSNTHH